MGITYESGENSTSGSGRSMGLFYGYEKSCFKRKYRWMFTLPGIAGDPDPSANVLPPSKASRPNLTFKEIEAQHISETIYFPGKPDWKPISITLYDNKNNYNPVFEYIRNYYDPSFVGKGNFKYSSNLKIPKAKLELYSGCGNPIESWVFENVWPQQIEFGELDMSESGVVTVDLTLRYDRAWVQENENSLTSISNNDFSPSTPFNPDLPPNLSIPDFPSTNPFP